MAPRKRIPTNRSQDRAHRRKKCIDCVDEGVTTTRKSPYPGPRCATHHRARRSTRRSLTQEARWEQVYGITADEYWTIYDFQGGACAICQRATGIRKRLSVDHCHKSGAVRGLLCQPCNRNVLGHLRDEVAAFLRAVEYLENPPAVEVIGWRVVPEQGAPVKKTRSTRSASPKTNTT